MSAPAPVVPIVLSDLAKRYGDFTAVDALSLEVARGEVFGFLGPNGAGKTTTIRMMMGILVPSAGSARIEGWDCQQDRVEVARRVGFLPDNPAFYDYLRGREIVEFVAETLWQKATDKLPYLLDPTAAPAAAVSLADGMLAAIFFLVLQPLLGWLFSGYFHKEQAVVVAFIAAGALTAAGARLIHGLSAARGAPRFFAPRGGRALLYGLFGGVVAAALGALYVIAYHRVPWLRELLRPQPPTELEAGWWLAALAIFAAPLFEEFIFRGLVFTGLRRSLPLPVAVLASAAVFAVVHPPASALPVGLLGAICAVIYDRTGLLIAPMLTHAVYNAAIVALQM